MPGCYPGAVAGSAATVQGLNFARGLRAMLATYTGLRTAQVSIAAVRCVDAAGIAGVPGAPPPAAVALSDPANADPVFGALGAAARRELQGGPAASPPPTVAAFTSISLLWSHLPPALPAATYAALCPLSLTPVSCVVDRLNALSPPATNFSVALRSGAGSVMAAWVSVALGGGLGAAPLVCTQQAPLCGIAIGGAGAARLPAAGAAAALAAAAGVGQGGG